MLITPVGGKRLKKPFGKLWSSTLVRRMLTQFWALPIFIQVAEIYAYRGDRDKAFEWLDRAYRQRDGGLSGMKGDPLLLNLEHDPRWTAFLNKMKLPLN
jgi:hypothetical protein